MMRRTLALFVLLSTLIGCPKKPDRTCAVTAVGCACKTEPFNLTAGWTPSTTCDAPQVAPGVVSSCCYDVDSAGESSLCVCGTGACAERKDKSACVCDLFTSLDADQVQVGECRPAPPTRCCKGPSYCNCLERPACTATETEVQKCVPTDVTMTACRAPGPGRAQTCGTLKWRKR